MRTEKEQSLCRVFSKKSSFYFSFQSPRPVALALDGCDFTGFDEHLQPAKALADVPLWIAADNLRSARVQNPGMKLETQAKRNQRPATGGQFSERQLGNAVAALLPLIGKSPANPLIRQILKNLKLRMSWFQIGIGKVLDSLLLRRRGKLAASCNP